MKLKNTCAVAFASVSMAFTGCNGEPQITDCATGPIVVSDAAGVDKLAVKCVQGDVSLENAAATTAWSARPDKPRFITGKLRIKLNNGSKPEGTTLLLGRLKRADIEVFSGAPVVLDAPELVEGSVTGGAPITLKAPLLAHATELQLVDADLPALVDVRALSVGSNRETAAKVTAPLLQRVERVSVQGAATVDLGAARPSIALEVRAKDLSGLSFVSSTTSLRQGLTLTLTEPTPVSLPVLRSAGRLIIQGASSVELKALESVATLEITGPATTIDAPVLLRAGGVRIEAAPLARLNLPLLHDASSFELKRATALPVLALPALDRLRSKGFKLEDTEVQAVQLPLLTSVTEFLQLTGNVSLTELAVPQLVFADRVVIRGNAKLPAASLDGLRETLPPHSAFEVCGNSGDAPCRWSSTGQRYTVFMTATGSENLRESMAAGLSGSSGKALFAALPKAPKQQLVARTGSFAAVLASDAGVPQKFAAGVTDISTDVVKSIQTWVVPPLGGTATTRFLPFASEPKTAFTQNAPSVALLVVNTGEKATTFTAYTILADKLTRAGSGQLTTAEAAEIGFFGFGHGTELYVADDRIEVTQQRPDRDQLPIVFAGPRGGELSLDRSLLRTTPQTEAPRRWVEAARALPPPEKAPEQTEQNATSALGACRLAVPVAPCPTGAVEHTTKTESWCTLWDDRDAPRIGRVLKYEANDCAEMASATTHPFVRVLEMGSSDESGPTGTWFTWQIDRRGSFFLSSVIQYRDSLLHGVRLTCSPTGECTRSTSYSGASVDDL